MNTAEDLIPTRQSLLSRLKDWNDQESWRVFFDTYWRLIYGAAIKAGLSDAEAQDVVQETVLTVMKNMATFQYDAKRGFFKGWLLRQTSWKIRDEVRKRRRGVKFQAYADASTNRATMEQIADPVGLALEAIWDKEWEKNLMEAAIERVKRKVDAIQYQIFDLHVFKEWPATRVAQAFKVRRAHVYLVKHRINILIKKELMNLRTKPI